jgi:hypothetical protein
MPPGFATWLLEAPAPDERCDSLVGDFVEQVGLRRIRNRMYIAFLLTLLGSAASGGIVGRLHRERQTAMVFVYLASAIVVAGVQMAVQVRLIGWNIRPVAQYPQTLVLFFVLVPVSILLGGLWRRTRSSIRYGTSTTGARQNATF